MGDVKIPYYVTRGGENGTRKMAYWAPCLARRSKKSGEIEPTPMAKLGFAIVDLGEHGPLAWAKAKSWNDKWKAARAAWIAAGRPERPHEVAAVDARERRTFPAGSLGEGFARFRETNAWLTQRAAATREDWWRGWNMIEPVFGDVEPNTIALEDIDGWYTALLNRGPGTTDNDRVREAHRAMKIWRAMWNVLGTIKRTDGERYVTGKDPSLGIRRKNPKPRDAFWLHEEAWPVIEAAWAGVTVRGKQERFQGLAAALAVAWDSMLSPVDVRRLSLSRLVRTAEGRLFDVDRAKSGAAAIATLTARADELLDGYIASLPFTLHPSMPIFHTRGGAPGPKGGRPRPPAPYTRGTLAKDFRIVRAAVFPGEKRKISDFRRSGALEVKAGKGSMSDLASKMANTIDTNPMLQDTYLPADVLAPDATSVRQADAARERGRLLMSRSRKPGGAA